MKKEKKLLMLYFPLIFCNFFLIFLQSVCWHHQDSVLVHINPLSCENEDIFYFSPFSEDVQFGSNKVFLLAELPSFLVLDMFVSTNQVAKIVVLLPE